MISSTCPYYKLLENVMCMLLDINECLSIPCQNGAICEDDVNGYNCACVPGFTGVLCETGQYTRLCRSKLT